jgi:hypothetical protein
MRTVKRELLFFALIGLLFFMATAFDAFNTEQNYVGENPDRVEPGRLTLDDRFAYAMLLNAGYVTVELVPASNENNHTPHFSLTDQESHELDCISNKVGDATRDAPEGSGLQNLGSPHALVEAILAAEKYNRGPLQRSFETAVARGTLYFTGHVPEMSLGVAQVKPSVARTVLPQTELGLLSEGELLDYLLDDCSSAYVASAYVAAILRAEPPDRPVGQVIADVAAQYNGGGNPAYLSVVKSAYELLTNSYLDQPSDTPIASAGNALRLCAAFETGMPEGAVLVDTKDKGTVPVNAATRKALASAQGISVAMAQWEPGPKSYLARLSQMRLDWISKALRDLGLPPGTLMMVRSEKPAGQCGIDSGGEGDALAQTSVGVITVTLPPAN